MKIILFFILLTSCIFSLFANTKPHEQEHAVQQFIHKMVSQYHFKKDRLDKLFNSIKKNQAVIDLMNRPYEAKPWYDYQKLFVSESHITNGVLFWRKYRGVLKKVSERTGVPPQIIVAIIGVESRYGQHKGTYPALETLYSFAFYFPRRAEFFQHELAQYLLLCREQKWDPLHIKGSYAAALGQPQFMPSSYRAYAKGYKQQEAKVNLFDYEPDVIASVANYFAAHGWQKQQPIAIEAKVNRPLPSSIEIAERSSHLKKPYTTLQQYAEYGVTPMSQTTMSREAILLRYDLAQGHQYWFGFYNFYVITRYNRSILYAMAVYQLSEKIKVQYEKQYH
jgi:membrane-bound lytic murein transglycosylase B